MAFYLDLMKKRLDLYTWIYCLFFFLVACLGLYLDSDFLVFLGFYCCSMMALIHWIDRID